MKSKLLFVVLSLQSLLCQEIEPEPEPEDKSQFYTDQPWGPVNALPPGPWRNCSACACNCDCASPISNPWLVAPPTCPPCPPGMPRPPPSNVTINGTTGAVCAQRIREASAALGGDVGSLLGAIVGFLLSNLVEILRLVLAGNNSLTGAVLPLVEIVCHLLGLVLLLLQSIGALGVLGPNGLLDSLVTALTG